MYLEDKRPGERMRQSDKAALLGKMISAEAARNILDQVQDRVTMEAGIMCLSRGFLKADIELRAAFMMHFAERSDIDKDSTPESVYRQAFLKCSRYLNSFKQPLAMLGGMSAQEYVQAGRDPKIAVEALAPSRGC